MTQSAIQAAIQQICQEKHISEESVLYTIELALAAAFRKDFGNKMQNIITEFDPKTGQVKVFDFKTVVEDLPAEELAELKGQAEKEIKEVEAVRDEKSFITEESLESQEEVRRFNPKTEIQISEALKIKKSIITK